MNESLDPRKQLKIQQGIRQAEDKLVTDIQTALEDTTSYGDLEESQFRNLVRVADTTESTAVIKNFLLYQVGRDKKWGRGKLFSSKNYFMILTEISKLLLRILPDLPKRKIFLIKFG
jgi:hypothetical protein